MTFQYNLTYLEENSVVNSRRVGTLALSAEITEF